MDVLFAYKWVVNCCLQTTPFTPSQVSTGELWQQRRADPLKVISYVFTAQ